MTKVIIFTNEFGGTSVCTPTGEIPIEKVQKEHVPEGVQSYIVDDSTLPQNDWDFFDAWVQKNGNVFVDINKAKEVAKKRIRFLRQPLLDAQDIAFQRALETGVDTKTIIAEKQRLRDLTKLPDTAQTLDELRAIRVEAV